MRTIRALENADLKVTKSICDSKGRTRTFVSLAGASFVNKTYWFSEAVMCDPKTLERVKLDLATILKQKTEQLDRFIQCPSTKG